MRLVFGGVAPGGVFAGDGVGSGRYGDVVIVGADVGAFRAAGRLGVGGPGRPDGGVLAEQVADGVTVRGVGGGDRDLVDEFVVRVHAQVRLVAIEGPIA